MTNTKFLTGNWKSNLNRDDVKRAIREVLAEEKEEENVIRRKKMLATRTAQTGKHKTI